MSRIMNTVKYVLLLVAFVVAVPQYASADINPMINYQGRLTDDVGTAVANDAYNMRFRLYTTPTGGAAIFTETLTGDDAVTVTGGLFSVMIGSTTDITGVDFNQTLYLGVEIGGTDTVTPDWDGEMTPRKVIGSVPAAFVADTLDGLDSTQFLRSDATGTLTGSLTISGNSTTTSATTTNLFSTTASSTNLFSTSGNIGSLTLGTLTSGLINGQTISSTANFTGTITATGGLTTLSNLLLTGSSTLQNLTFVNATGTSATTTNLFATTGNFTNLCIAGDCQTTWPSGGSDFPFTATSYGVSTSTIVGFEGGLMSLGSTTIYDLIATRSTTTSATTTNLFSTTASSTNLFASLFTLAGRTLQLSDDAVIGGTNTGDVTLAGTNDYITISGQTITRGIIDVSDDTNLTAGDHLTLTGDDLDVDDDFILNTGDTGTGIFTFSDLISTRSTSTNATTTTLNVDSLFTGAGLSTCNTSVDKLLWANGTFSCGTDQSSGGGGSDSNWTFFNGSGLRLATTSNQVVLGATSTSTLSKLEIIGGLDVDNSTTTNATTTNLAVTTLCLTGDICRTTWPSGGSDFPFTATSYGVSTSTIVGFEGGLMSLGSTTIYDLIATRSTTTSATTTNLFSTTASSTNLFSTSGNIGSLTAGSLTASNLLLSGSTTLQNLTFVNATGTSATTTNLFVTNGNFDNINVSQYSGYKINNALILSASSTNFSVLVGQGAGEDLLSDGIRNTAVGYQALNVATSSDQNTAVGYFALSANTVGGTNTALGYSALQSNTTGNQNTAIGNVLSANTTGSNNVAIGSEALNSNISGSSNIALGYRALLGITSATNNIAIGERALNESITGNENVAIGGFALQQHQSATSTVAVGYSAAAGTANYTNQNGVYVGFQSGSSVTTGSDNNTFVGYRSGQLNTSGANNTLFGYQAGNNITTGSSNLILGYDIDAPSATASNQLNIGNIIFGTSIDGTGTTLSTGNIGIGTTTPGSKLDVYGFINTDQYSGYKQAGNTVLYASSTNFSTLVGQGAGAVVSSSGTNNTAVGYQSLTANTTGSSNTAVGYQSLVTNITGSFNTAVGQRALRFNTSNNNTAFGFSALSANVSGDLNVAVGTNALSESVTGGGNIAIGSNALLNNQSATSTVAIGTNAATGGANYSSQRGVYIGHQSGLAVLTGSNNNTFVGYNSGLVNTTGANNTLLGYSAGDNVTTGSGNLIIGYDVEAPSATASNQLNIGNIIFGTSIDGTGTTLSTGNIGIGTTSPYAKLAVVGEVVGAYFTATTTLNNTFPNLIFTSATGTSATTTNLFSTTASSTNLFSTSGNIGSLTAGSLTASNLLLSGSTTLQNFTFINATGTNATTTNLFATTASSTNLFSSLINVGSSAFTVNSSGQIGVGTASPFTSSILTVGVDASGDNSTNAVLMLGTTDLNSPSVNGTYIGTNAQSGFTGNFLDYQLNSVRSFAVDSDGEVTTLGGGTSNLSATELSLYQPNGTVTIGNSGDFGTGANLVLQAGAGGIGSNIDFSANGSTIGRFNSTGFGIGTTTPWAKLAVNIFNGGSQNQFIVASSTGSGATSTSFIIDRNGNVGVGTSNPNYLLEVNGTASTTNLYATNGTTTNATSTNLAVTNLCLTGDTCITEWPSGGSASTDKWATSSDPLLVEPNSALGVNVSQYSGYHIAGNLVLHASSTNFSVLVGQGAGEDLLSDGLRNTAIGYNSLNVNTSSDDNTAVGYLSLSSNDTGSQNTAMGVQTLQVNSSGAANSAFGYRSLLNNTSGTFNAAFGSGSLQSNISGGSNTAIGASALSTNITGTNNTAVGYTALQRNQSATSSVAVGYGAASGNGNYSNQRGVYVGYQSGLNLTTGSNNNTFVGYNSGMSNSSGANNTLFGYQSGDNITTGSNNLILGYDIDAPSATASNQLNIGNIIFGTSIDGTGTTLSTGNIGIGTTTPGSKLDVYGFINTDQYSGYKQAGNTILYASSTNFSTLVGNGAGVALAAGGTGNTALGHQALNALTTGDDSTAVGYRALRFSTGTGNTAVGSQALTANTTGTENTAVGGGALQNNTEGTFSSAFGHSALVSNTTGGFNNAFGYSSLSLNTTGVLNVAFGNLALSSNTTGSRNIGVGSNSLQNSITGEFNTAVGDQASRYNTSATGTVAVGYGAARGNTSGFSGQGITALGYSAGIALETGSNYNTLLGYAAGNLITTGANNILIGANSNETSNNLTTGSNNISIGYNISLPSATASNQLNIGNIIFGRDITGTGTTLAGSIGIGTTTPRWLLQLATSTAPQLTLSDGSLTSDHWSFRNIGGNFYLATSSPTTFATSTTAALSIDTNGEVTIENLFVGDSAGTGDAGTIFGAENYEWTIGYESSDHSFRISSSTSFGTNDIVTIAKSTGYVGIGTTTPGAKLNVIGALCVDDGTPTCANSARTDGTIYSVAALSASLDLAESYPTKDDTLGAGEIVMLDDENEMFVSRAEEDSDMPLMGIVSTNPGFWLGGFNDEVFAEEIKLPIALSGRVPTKVNDEGGEIEIGDRIAISSVAGEGRKATSTEHAVGIALESMSDEEGTIEVFVNLSGPTEDAKMLALENRMNTLELNLASASFSVSTTTNQSLIATVLEAIGATIVDTVTYFKNLVVETLTVGSAEKPVGITLFDTETGEPYCFMMRDGEPVTEEGECGSIEDNEQEQEDTSDNQSDDEQQDNEDEDNASTTDEIIDEENNDNGTTTDLIVGEGDIEDGNQEEVEELEGENVPDTENDQEAITDEDLVESEDTEDADESSLDEGVVDNTEESVVEGGIEESSGDGQEL